MVRMNGCLSAATAWILETTHLVDGNPVLDPIAQTLKQHLCKCDKVTDDLLRLPSFITLLQLERVVPVIDGNAGSDSFGQEGIDLP